ncbi:hypothetical protein AURDEDRAFT_171337 [Auricularia subglabra TFB-10046 SS5]|uniref:Fungal-type protein kinase domain-containing protein n=1 Tax=Auricularia subglabra (strain TFB-10046 / SS5) TaxID=717982 RepID=J0WXA0_AURST|nr:hypothetical protein AURDEDRAFT_171337 [Auricularia subglabra TFB-10046 SS5]
MSVRQMIVIVEARIRAHSVIDDFESCIWVTFYTILLAYHRRHSRAERIFFEGFTTDQYGRMLSGKSRMLRLNASDKEWGSALSATWELWGRLFPIANEAQVKLDRLMSKYSQPNHEDADERSDDGANEEASQNQEDEGGQFPPPPPPKKRVNVFHAELEKLTEDVFYQYMHAIQDALELLPEEGDAPDA